MAQVRFPDSASYLCGLSLLALFSALRGFSVREILGSILGDLTSVATFRRSVKLKLQIPVKRSTDRGRGIKDAPSASTDNIFVTEGTIHVK